MKRITVSVCVALCLSLIGLPPAQGSEGISGLSRQSIGFAVKPQSVLPTPKINRVFNTNQLNVSVGKLKKTAEVTYQWIRNGEPIPEEIGKTYEWQIPDCGQSIQVRVQVVEKGSKKLSKLSRPYNPEICTFTTGDLPAWNLLYQCGATSCKEWTFNKPGGFYGFVYRSEKAQSWFRVQFPDVDPSKVISWQAQARGLGRSWALGLVMITKNEPTWTCCDWKGTKFPTVSYNGSEVSDEVLGLSTDGSAYVGFDYYDKFGVYEGFTVDTIKVTLKFR